jgi:hypothetical protein
LEGAAIYVTASPVDLLQAHRERRHQEDRLRRVLPGGAHHLLAAQAGIELVWLGILTSEPLGGRA